jgi:hypothetical protein
MVSMVSVVVAGGMHATRCTVVTVTTIEMGSSLIVTTICIISNNIATTGHKPRTVASTATVPTPTSSLVASATVAAIVSPALHGTKQSGQPKHIHFTRFSQRTRLLCTTIGVQNVHFSITRSSIKKKREK